MNLSDLLPAAALWRGSQVNGIEDFAVDLDPEQGTTLEVAAIELSARSVNPTDTEPGDLPLGQLAETIGRVREELLYGSGMVLLRGLPVDRLSSSEIALYFWGIGLRLGRAVSQSVMGERLGRVVDVTDVDPHARAYRNRSELTPHTDPADLLAFLCLTTAANGGESQFVSSLTVYDELCDNYPEVVAVLERGFHYHRFGEQEAGCPPVTPWKVPIFSQCDGRVSCRYVKEYVEIAEDEDPEIELSTAEREALTIFETTTQREDLRVVFTLQPGEAILANNYTVLHGRTAFTSHPENKRELLRLWLASDPPRPVVPEVYIYEQAYHGGETGVPPQPGLRPSFPSRFDQT
ncbi:MAG: TauD/TfdA family dioxygenase [Actinomycetota bacterium]|nr:TauD/TfdA family dioxygenase [Actinomycetota bacterium]